MNKEVDFLNSTSYESKKEPSDDTMAEWNIDNAIEEQHQNNQQLSTDDEITSVNPLSIGEILKQNAARDSVNKYLNNLKREISSTTEKKTKNNIKALMPVEWNNDGNQFAGKHFSVTDPPGTETLCYEVYICIDHTKDATYYSMEPVNHAEEELAGGNIRRTFYIDDPQNAGNRLVLVVINDTHIIVFRACLIEDEVRFSSKATTLRNNINTNIGHGSSIKNSGCYDLSGLTENQIIQITHGEPSCEVSANLDSNAIIIDPVTKEQVLRSVYFDELKKEWKATVKIFPHRSYFILQIHYQDGEKYKKIDLATLGYYYAKGIKGYPKDLETAISFLESNDSPRAQYYLSQLLLDEELIKDETTAVDYLKRAASGGEENAILELYAIYTETEIDIKTLLPYIDPLVVLESHTGQFLNACFRELIGDGSLESIFSMYYASALQGYKPAQCRISIFHSSEGEKWKNLVTREECYDYFIKTMSENSGDVEHCLGSVLLYGWEFDNTPRKTNAGLRLLSSACRKGNISAVSELVEYSINNDSGFLYLDSIEYLYSLIAAKEDAFELVSLLEGLQHLELGNSRIDVLESIIERLSILSKAFESINNPKKLYNLANRLLNIEPPHRQADQIAKKALERAVRLDNSYATAINDLAWIYKNGRGAETDYKKAQELFEKALNLGCIASAKNLGVMFEQGNGVIQDIEKAKYYYNIGAAAGNKNCAERLKVIAEKETIEKKKAMENVLLNMDEIQKTVNRIDYTTQQIKTQMDNLVAFAENDLQKWLKQQKSDLHTIQSGQEYDSAVDSYIHTASAYINSNVQTEAIVVQQEKENLQNIFGDIWNHLLPTTQTSLISAAVMWRCCSGITNEDFDYSGVCISATSALEGELKKIFYHDLQKYISQKYGDVESLSLIEVKNIWPEELLNITWADYKRRKNRGEEPILSLGHNFTMGKLPFLFGKNSNNKQLLLGRMNEYLQTVVKKEYAHNPLKAFNDYSDPKNFVNQCEKVRIKYRNPAAHTDVLSKDCAYECYNTIVGKVDALLYRTEIAGLILSLYSFLEN